MMKKSRWQWLGLVGLVLLAELVGRAASAGDPNDPEELSRQILDAIYIKPIYDRDSYDEPPYVSVPGRYRKTLLRRYAGLGHQSWAQAYLSFRELSKKKGIRNQSTDYETTVAYVDLPASETLPVTVAGPLSFLTRDTFVVGFGVTGGLSPKIPDLKLGATFERQGLFTQDPLEQMFRLSSILDTSLEVLDGGAAAFLEGFLFLISSDARSLQNYVDIGSYGFRPDSGTMAYSTTDKVAHIPDLILNLDLSPSEESSQLPAASQLLLLLKRAPFLRPLVSHVYVRVGESKIKLSEFLEDQFAGSTFDKARELRPAFHAKNPSVLPGSAMLIQEAFSLEKARLEALRVDLETSARVLRWTEKSPLEKIRTRMRYVTYSLEILEQLRTMTSAWLGADAPSCNWALTRPKSYY